MADRRYVIPADHQAKVLRLHYSGHSDRAIYLALYPQGSQVSGQPKLGTFADALHALIRETEESLRTLALREGVPHVSPANPPSDAEAADIIALGEPVGEEPLAPADAEALADCDAARAAVLNQIRLLSDPANPPPPEPPPEAGRWTDPLAERAKVIGQLGAVVGALTSVRLRGAATRMARTVTLHNLRIARREAEEAERDGAEPGIPDVSRLDAAGRPAPARGLLPAAPGDARTDGRGTGGFRLDLPSA